MMNCEGKNVNKKPGFRQKQLLCEWPMHEMICGEVISPPAADLYQLFVRYELS